MVRTVTLFAPVCSASAPGYFVVFLRAHRQSAAGNGFDAVISSTTGTLPHDYRHSTSCAHQRFISDSSYCVYFLCHFLSFGINARQLKESDMLIALREATKFIEAYLP